MAVYLALGFAVIFAAVTAFMSPPPSRPAAILIAIVPGALSQIGLFWSPSAKGRKRVYALLLMIPSAVFLTIAAVAEVPLVFGGRMHSPPVAFGYIGGVAVYWWQLYTLIRRER
jgi:hypothetical protein